MNDGLAVSGMNVPARGAASSVSAGIPARQALLVLGMHRSGTSALTRVLGLCGAALPQHKMAAAADNALGFWEPQPIVDAHDRFLKDAGTGWDAIADYPAALFASEAAAACRRGLADLTLREYGNAQLFILKDPRISRLMPLWLPLLNTLGVAPRIVIAARNPLEIASSMRARDGWSEHRTLMLWLRYMLAAERDTRGLVRCFVGYEQLVNDWRGTVDRVSEVLGLAFPARSPAVEREIDGFIRPDMRHHRHGADALLQRDDIADCVKQAWRCFGDAAETGAVDGAVLDRIGGLLAEAEAALERKPHGARHATTEAEQVLTALMLAELERANDAATRAQCLIDEMRATWTWRATKPLRALGRMVGRRP
jgi:hypothetical protein